MNAHFSGSLRSNEASNLQSNDMGFRLRRARFILVLSLVLPTLAVAQSAPSATPEPEAQKCAALGDPKQADSFVPVYPSSDQTH